MKMTKMTNFGIEKMQIFSVTWSDHPDSKASKTTFGSTDCHGSNSECNIYIYPTVSCLFFI